ncbi:anti-repressor SinI family protein [Heyndrickxia acidicola]|uniref:Anti-repressor SinI family protein n=1 Tax=Heyndrickxia acidicola TaxID=209389 RepID=A0ABU6MKN0_9BACI|nr:anti-repressor SinI family protein [Heyndrickxia acidicola]MED1204952.1 anti-repressor SinI family protein [Heyndrickxia acidicola]
MKKGNQRVLDKDWLELILSAKQLGLSIQEIKDFLSIETHEQRKDNKQII